MATTHLVPIIANLFELNHKKLKLRYIFKKKISIYNTSIILFNLNENMSN